MSDKKTFRKVKTLSLDRSVTEGAEILKRKPRENLHLPILSSPINYSLKGLSTSKSTSTNHTTTRRLQATRSREIESIDLGTSIRPVQTTGMFKKKSLWPLLTEIMRLRDNRQNLSVLEVILDSIRENLIMVNFISEMPQKREIEIIHEKLSSGFRQIYREMRTLSDSEIFTRKFLSEIRFSIQPLTLLFGQYIDSINVIRKYLASIADIYASIDKEFPDAAPKNVALSIKQLSVSILAEHVQLNSMIDEMKCLMRHSSNRLRSVANLAPGNKIKTEFEKIATRAIKFYEKSYQEASYITRVTHKDLRNYLFQMESELAVITPYYKRYYQLNAEISKIVRKQEKYLDFSNRVKALQTEIENFYTLKIARNTQVPMLESASPENESTNLGKLLERLKAVRTEICNHKKDISTDIPSENISILINQLYDLANKNKEFINEAERNIDKMQRTIEALESLKNVSVLMQELVFKHRSLKDEIEVYLTESGTIPEDQLENVGKFFAEKREEVRVDLLNYFSQIVCKVAKIKKMHPELEKYTNIFENTAKNGIQAIERLVLKLCDKTEDKGIVSIYEIYENYRIILREESKYFPNYLNNPDLLLLIDDLIDISIQHAAFTLDDDDTKNIANEADKKFSHEIKESLVTLQTLHQNFKTLVTKYFLNPEKNLDYFEEFSIEAPNFREQAEQISKDSEFDWEINFIVDEQIRYINAFEECLIHTRKIACMLTLDVLINLKSFESLLAKYYQYQYYWTTFEASFNNHKAYSKKLFCFNRKIVQAVEVLVILRAIFENKDYYIIPGAALKISEFLDGDTDVFPELTAIKELVENLSETLVLIADTSEAVDNIVNLWYKKAELDFAVLRKIAENNETSKQLVAEKTSTFEKKFGYLDKNQSMACRFAIYKTEAIFISFFLQFAGVKRECCDLEENTWELIRAEKSIVAIKSNLLKKIAEMQDQLEVDQKTMDPPNGMISDLQSYFLEYLKNLLRLQVIEIQSDIEMNILENCSPMEEALYIIRSNRFISKFYELIWRKAITKEHIPAEIQSAIRKYGMTMTMAGSVFYRTSTKAYVGRVMVIIDAGSIKFNCKLEDYIRMTTDYVELIEETKDSIVSDEHFEWSVNWIIKSSRINPSEVTITLSEY